jgi:hypothetical protein
MDRIERVTTTSNPTAQQNKEIEDLRARMKTADK